MESPARPNVVASLQERERASLENIALVARNNMKALQGNEATLFGLAKKSGFEVKRVPLGTQFIDARGQTQAVTAENSARIGPGNALYVGINSDGKPYDLEDIRHDVGAILLGGKHPSAGQTASVRFETYAGLVKKHTGRTISPDELIAQGVAVRDAKGNVMI